MLLLGSHLLGHSFAVAGQLDTVGACQMAAQPLLAGSWAAGARHDPLVAHRAVEPDDAKAVAVPAHEGVSERESRLSVLSIVPQYQAVGNHT